MMYVEIDKEFWDLPPGNRYVFLMRDEHLGTVEPMIATKTSEIRSGEEIVSVTFEVNRGIQ